MTIRSYLVLFLPLAVLLAGCGNGGGAASSPGPSTVPNVTTSTTTVNTTLPAAPAGLAAIGTTNQVTVSWSPVTGATSYNVYWTNDPTHVMRDMGATKIAGATSAYRHTSLSAGATYAYVVTAVNSAGESAESEVASAVTSTTDGLALYQSRCSGCHNPLAISEKKGRTAAQIQGAISANRGGMGSLSSLSQTDNEAIAAVLGF